MSKSNYENWAEREQPKKLQETATLNDAAILIGRYSAFLSDDLIRGMKTLVGGLHNLQADELDRLIGGCEYWMV